MCTFNNISRGIFENPHRLAWSSTQLQHMTRSWVGHSVAIIICFSLMKCINVKLNTSSSKGITASIICLFHSNPMLHTKSVHACCWSIIAFQLWLVSANCQFPVFGNTRLGTCNETHTKDLSIRKAITIFGFCRSMTRKTKRGERGTFLQIFALAPSSIRTWTFFHKSQVLDVWGLTVALELGTIANIFCCQQSDNWQQHTGWPLH